MTKKKAIEPVDTEALEVPEAPSPTAAIPEIDPAELLKRKPWCPKCFGAALHGPEAKLDASGAFRVYSPAGEACAFCGEPAAHYASTGVHGAVYGMRDGTRVSVVEVLCPQAPADVESGTIIPWGGTLRVCDVGSDPSTAREVSVRDLACL